MKPNGREKEFVVALVTEVLAAQAPEEVAIYEVASDDIWRHASMRAVSAADGDAYFGGLEPSLGEILTHTLALIAADFIKDGILLTRDKVREYLRNRRPRAGADAADSDIEVAERQILAVLESQGDAASEAPPNTPEATESDTSGAK